MPVEHATVSGGLMGGALRTTRLVRPRTACRLGIARKARAVAKADTGALRVEKHSIDRIPDEERHGSPRGLFAVWFGANLQLTTVVTGALAPSLGLSIPWALLAIILGNLFGAVFMALHSAQGPRLGIPQMIS